jgi:superoxide dismutase
MRFIVLSLTGFSLLIVSCAPPVQVNEKPAKLIYSPQALKPDAREMEEFKKQREQLRKQMIADIEKEFQSFKKKQQDFEQMRLKPFLGDGNPF